MLIFPAIDLLGGKAVRLRQGLRETATVYSERPWELAAAFAAAGAPRIHVVDLDAAFTKGQQNNHDTIRRIAAATTIRRGNFAQAASTISGVLMAAVPVTA